MNERQKNIVQNLKKSDDIKEMREKEKKTKGGISILSIAETTVMDGFKR